MSRRQLDELFEGSHEINLRQYRVGSRWSSPHRWRRARPGRWGGGREGAGEVVGAYGNNPLILVGPSISTARMLVLISAAAAGSLLLPDPSTLRVICSDVDGTLLTPSHVTTERTAAAVLRSMDRAEHFCCATGRGRVAARSASASVSPRGHRACIGAPRGCAAAAAPAP